MAKAKDINVFGEELAPCSLQPSTGFFRTGCCSTGSQDLGRHVVCAELTEEFLEFSKDQGNDLTTPDLASGFPGLKPGDRWCLCIERWKEALAVGIAPPLFLQATHRAALLTVDFAVLQEHALDVN